jgi:hypothetical protein
MLENARGKYICFIDDDDVISDKYLLSFVGMIGKDYDCSDLRGMYYNGLMKKQFYHSILIDEWKETIDCYLRCPNHLNMIRKSIAQKVKYKSLRTGEDVDFSLRLKKSNLIKNEFKSDEILYHYVDGIKELRNKISFESMPLEIVHKPWKYKYIKNEPIILVKLPSRGRPLKLLNTLKFYVQKSCHKHNIYYMITLDVDDYTATNELKQILENIHENVSVNLGISTSKIHACNRDMTPEIVSKYDIFILASDDMIPMQQNWDIKICDTMNSVFPFLDGVLHFNDGFRGKHLNTMCIIGREYYKKFNYFYHPDYQSLWCDNEFTDISMETNKCYYENTILFKHCHPANIGESYDDLYIKNEKFFDVDRLTFNLRKEQRITLNSTFFNQCAKNNYFDHFKHLTLF